MTAVENDEEIANAYKAQFNTDNVLVCDAHEYLLNHFHEYDFIWSSPPCQSHSRMMKGTRHTRRVYPDMSLYQEIVLLKHFFKGKWVVENVVPYYEALMPPTKKLGRHLFWSNFYISAVDIKSPSNFINNGTVEAANELADWLGIKYEKPIYYKGNHCPAQVLRNCVHPLIGNQVFSCALQPGGFVFATVPDDLRVDERSRT